MSKRRYVVKQNDMSDNINASFPSKVGPRWIAAKYWGTTNAKYVSHT